MKTTLLLAACCAALSHASVLKTPMHVQGPAKVRVSATRSPLEPVMVEVEAFDERHKLRLVPAPSVLSPDFKLQTTRTVNGKMIIEDMEENSGLSDVYHDPDTGAMLLVDGAAVDGIITPSITIESLHDGTHRAVRRYDSKASIHDFLEVPAGIKNDTKSMKSTEAVLEVSPEVYVVVDSTLAKTLASKKGKIKKYLAVFWNGVQQRFATMNDPKVKLILSSALIAK